MSEAPTHGHPSHNGEDHNPSKLFTLFAIQVELFALVALVLVTKFTITHRSGLNEPDKIHRIWARAPEIRFQPIPQRLAFAVAVGYGVQTVVHTIFTSVINALGIKIPAFGFFGILLKIVATGSSPVVSILIFRAAGGESWALPFLSTFLFDVFMYYLLIIVSGVTQRVADHSGEPSFDIALILFLGVPVIMLLTQAFFVPFAANKKLPATARLIYNTTPIPNWVKLDRTILVAAGPLAIIHFIGYTIQSRLGHHTYLTRISYGLSTLMLLAVSSLASIISVNRALLSNEFQWQWRAFLTPAIPLFVLDVLLDLFNVIRGKMSFAMVLFVWPHLFLGYGACGALGAYVYLLLGERYAQQHIDEDSFAESDLLGEYDEDEDNEELHV